MSVLPWNLAVGWLWLLLGALTGLALGLGFHREDWLGGYGSLRRRLYRLAHISFFGLGILNVLFWLTCKSLAPVGGGGNAAGVAFLLGAASMPACCVLMAHWAPGRWLFAFPVGCLLAGTAWMSWEVLAL